MVSRPNELIGSVVDYLNDNLYDPNSSNRIGSYVFGPDKEMNFKRQLPKVQVVFDNESSVDRSQGSNYKRTKVTFITPIFFTGTGDLDSTSNLKNEPLVMYMLEEIEQTLKGTTFDNFHLIGAGDTGKVEYSNEHGIYVGGIPLTFQRREQ